MNYFPNWDNIIEVNFTIKYISSLEEKQQNFKTLSIIKDLKYTFFKKFVNYQKERKKIVIYHQETATFQ